MDKFYVGTGELGFLRLPKQAVPDRMGFCLSHKRLARRPRRSPFPRAEHRWFLDSGMFGYCNEGLEPPTPEQYVAAVWRYDREIGLLDWAAQQDRMCEPWMLAKTGRTVAQNQIHGVANLKRLVDLWWEYADRDSAEHWVEHGYGEAWGIDLSDPATYRTPPEKRAEDTCPFMPTLQGWEPDDYRRHIDMFYAAGIRLEDYPVVGLGSVCRRAAYKPIQKLIEELSGYLDLHGFGLKKDAVRAFGPILTCADSQAWSEGTRHEEQNWPCRHGLVKWERNCWRHAIEWSTAVLDGAGDAIDWTDRWAGVPGYATATVHVNAVYDDFPQPATGQSLLPLPPLERVW